MNGRFLYMSVNKCCVLCIGKDDAIGQFDINGSPLPVVRSCRNLGITVTSNLLIGAWTHK